MIKDVTNVKLENLVIRGGIATNDSSYPDYLGGGIYVSKVSYLVIESNVVIRNNSANDGGGGLYLGYSTYTTISGSVYGNSATNYGGGLYLYYSSNNTISGSVYSNSANNSGGGLYLANSDYFTNIGWITNNNAYSGGGVYTNGSHPNSYFGNVSDNSPDDIAP